VTNTVYDLKKRNCNCPVIKLVSEINEHYDEGGKHNSKERILKISVDGRVQSTSINIRHSTTDRGMDTAVKTLNFMKYKTLVGKITVHR
jgi:hypothetical protein